MKSVPLRCVLIAIALTVAACGCASNPTTQTWPIKTMVDPVTEEIPHVIVNP